MEIHIKDKSSNDNITRRLGLGDTKFNEIGNALSKIKWQGLFVMETPVNDDWETEARHNTEFTKNWMKHIY